MDEIKPKAIKLNLESNEYQILLKGGRETVSMHSGLMILEPGKTVGKHSTEDKEEMIIVLEGEGKLIMNHGEELKLKYGYAAYCPSQTEHDVINTGTNLLKYIYIVSKIK